MLRKLDVRVVTKVLQLTDQTCGGVGHISRECPSSGGGGGGRGFGGGFGGGAPAGGQRCYVS